jgi:hypothetical protein
LTLISVGKVQEVELTEVPVVDMPVPSGRPGCPGIDTVIECPGEYAQLFVPPEQNRVIEAIFVIYNTVFGVPPTVITPLPVAIGLSV